MRLNPAQCPVGLPFHHADNFIGDMVGAENVKDGRVIGQEAGFAPELLLVNVEIAPG